jgi:hypothetical protein
MAGELPSSVSSPEADDKEDGKGTSDSRRTRRIPSALGDLLKPERQSSVNPQVAVRGREIGGLLFGEQDVHERVAEEKSKKKKKKEKAVEESTVVSSDKAEVVIPTPQPSYTHPEAVALGQEQPEQSMDLSKELNKRRISEEDTKLWAENAQEFELPDGSISGGETIIYLHEAAPAVEHEPRQEDEDDPKAKVKVANELPSSAVEADTDVLSPVTSAEELEWSERLRLAAEFESLSSESYLGDQVTPTSSVPRSAEVSAIGVPPEALMPVVEAGDIFPARGPDAPVEELTDDLPRIVPRAEYTGVSPTASPDGAWGPGVAYPSAQYGNVTRYSNRPSEQAATAREVDDAVYGAAQSGRAQGFLLGGALAYYGHLRHKRFRKNVEKNAKQQSKELRAQAKDQHFYFGEQRKQQAENTRRLDVAERHSTEMERQMYAHKQQAEQTTIQLAELQEASKRGKMVAPELAKQQMSDAGENITIPREHAMQNSAWHSIEIDKRTGRPVEKPTFAYGQEYYRERAHENRPSDPHSTIAGGVALAGATSPNDNGAQGAANSATSAPYIPSATTQGPPSARKKSASNAIRGRLTKSGSTGPLWPYLVALIVILFCLAILLN